MWMFIVAAMLMITVWSCDLVNATFIIHPRSAAVIEGREIELNCQVEPGKSPAVWYVYRNTPTSTSEAQQVSGGFQNRFFISQRQDVTNLYVNNTSPSDAGTYFCLSGTEASQNASLRVLSHEWVPRCTSSPLGVTEVGEQLDIVCLSNGDPDTYLRWMRNNDVISGSSRKVNGSSVFLYTTVTISDEAEVFICEASLPDLHDTEICVLRPTKGLQTTSGVQYVAYVVVGVLSVVVVILFIVMVVVILRQRQCRYCQRQLPPPQTVLDMDQLQSGLGIVFNEGGGDDTNSIGSAFDLTSYSPPPDVVPTVYRRGTLGQKSPTSTLRHNMDSSDEEKPGVKTPKLHSPTRTRRELDGLQLGTELENLGAGLESLGTDLEQVRDIVDVSLDPNLPSTSTGRASSRNRIASKSRTASRNRNSSKQNRDSLNDLGTLQKERLYRKSKMVNLGTKKDVNETDSVERNSDHASADGLSLNIKEDEE
ncbi:putative kin of IRRE-like protein 1 [Apostichopus japonicus]|uniref:Putative kin of IRRE-like protein 1 n=1 Tax=Stichopus japonicus TaxID=307972 RepID=A0A2G8LDT9_STIJA|nr:putative kin of IRRE-like protein 1 [Apostichopus japonicus]